MTNIMMIVLLFVSIAWSKDSRRYVCYTQKDAKGIYTGCSLHRQKCTKYHKKHFGKYPNEAGTYQALLRCTHATPRKTSKPIILKQIGMKKTGRGKRYQNFGLSGENKQNDYSQRLRNMIYTPRPGFIKKHRNGLDLFILDRIEKGYMAFYRSALSSSTYLFEAVIYSPKGNVVAEISLSNLIHSKYALEVQDIRYKEGILYFNAPSPTYAFTTKGRSAALYAYDLTEKKLLWRSRYLISNNIFLVEDDYIISGYGFSGERDYLYFIDRSSGKVLLKKRLDSAHNYLEIQGNKLFVITYNRLYTFLIETKKD